jgi:hypothetical protein
MPVKKTAANKRRETSKKKRGVSPTYSEPLRLKFKFSGRIIDPLENKGDNPFVGPPRPPRPAPSLADELQRYVDWLRDYLHNRRREPDNILRGWRRDYLRSRHREKNNTLRGWERGFRKAAANLLRVEPFIRYNGGPVDVESNRRQGTSHAINLLRESADYLRSLLVPEKGGPDINFDVAWCVSLMCAAYKRHKGGPHYKLVTVRMIKEFPKLFEKSPKNKEAWARDRCRTWERLQKDKEALERVKREHARADILSS